MMINVYIKCPCCHRDIPVFVEESDLDRYEKGMGLIQECFPYLNADERELFVSGVCKDCWHDIIGDDDEEEDEGCFDCDRADLEEGFDPYEGCYTFDC